MSTNTSSQNSATEWLTSRPLLLFVLFAIEILAIGFLRLPETMSFDSYAFCDNGANLTLQYVTSLGLRPTIDFGYNYGLLPILVGRIWFGIVGLSPISLQVLMVICDLAMVWAIASIASRIRFGAVGLALTAITLGFAVRASYPSLAHAVEAVLLVSALALQARGWRAGALAFACAAVFAKPSMGYVYSLVLVIGIVCERRQAGATFYHWIMELVPAVATGIALILVLGIVYGPVPLARTVIPIEGMSNYRAVNFGFFSAAGREFWDPHGLPWLFYLVDFSGFWIAGTLFLICSGVTAIVYLATGAADADLETRRNEMIATCAVLHVAFIAVFFGNQWSWIYYSYLLTIGVAAAAGASAAQHRVTIGLCLIGTLAWGDVAFWEPRWWQTRGPDAVTAGLWASADERAEWKLVLDSIHGSRAVVLDLKGAVELMFPEFERPVTLYMDPGLIKPLEIRRKVEQLSVAQMVVVPVYGIEACRGIPAAPEFATAIKSFEPRIKGKFFDVYQRPSPPRSPASK